jgi:mRNA interferase MazF
MLRGEVRLVDLDPAGGAEADRRRPAIVVSNDAANSMAAKLGRGVMTVVPGHVERRARLPVSGAAPRGRGRLAARLESAGRAGAVDRGRAVGTLLGRLPAPLMTSLDHALRLHLAL